MFTINGNLTGFTQYEQGYSLTNPNMKAGDMVCFASGSGESARAMAKEVEGVVLVEVPNILLGYTANVTATFEDGSDYTSFTVAPAPVPEGGWKPTFNEYKVGDAKVIDGTVCDEDGNVVVSGGGGAVDMSEYFETVGGDTLTWDGNTEGLEVSPMPNIMFNTPYYLVSTNVPTTEELAGGGTVTLLGGGQELSGVCAIEEIMSNVLAIIIEGSEVSVIVLADVSENDMLVKKGVYFTKGTVNGMDVQTISLTINGYTGFETTALKEEYIPVDYIKQLIAEVTGS